MKAKNFSLFVTLAAVAMLAACSDYKSEITQAHEDYVKANRAIPEEDDPSTQPYESHCTCHLDESNLIPIVNALGYTDMFFDPRSDSPVTWWLEGCEDAVSYSAYVNIAKVFWDNQYLMYNTLELTVSQIGKTSGFSGSGNVTFSAVNVYGQTDAISCPNVAFGMTPSDAEIARPSGTTPDPETSSSYSKDEATGSCGDLWCGLTDTEGQVFTGYENQDETSGYWYVFTDVNDNGTSAFTFPPDVEETVYGNFFGPLTEAYGGLMGSVELGDGYDYPYAGLAFNVIGQDGKGADITAWGGLCLVYQSTTKFFIELGVEDESTVTEFNNYKAPVPKSYNLTVADFPWKKFEQEIGWGHAVDQAEVLAKVATVKLKFTGTAGTGGDFLIQSIGRNGSCD